MSGRLQFQTSLRVDPTLLRLLREATQRLVTEEELREQRISFAFGNALATDLITKESVRYAAEHIRMVR